MIRRLAPLFLLVAAGCGGTGQPTTSVMSPTDPTARGANGVGGAKVDPVFKPAVGTNTPLGVLKPLSDKSPLAKPADGKIAADSVAQLAKLDKGALKLDNSYNYIVADLQSPRAPVGDKGATVPLPTEAKANPDGSIWVVDAETRRLYTLTGIKREADKPPVIGDALNTDLVRPLPEDKVPPLATVARAEDATGDVKHALRILVKGLGAEGAPAVGARVKLKKSASEKDVPPLAKAVVRALKKFGAVLESGDGAPALSALADPRWTKEDEKSLTVLHITDFELIEPPKKAGNSSKSKA